MQDIYYGIPDVLHRQRDRYACRRVLVVGSGQSTFNALLDLVNLSEEEPETAISWAIRRQDPGNMFGGGQNDALAARGELGKRIQSLVDAGRLTFITGFRTQSLDMTGGGVVVSDGSRTVAAALRGDSESARNVELELPETGVCSTSFGESEPAASACCGAAADAPSIPEPVLVGNGGCSG